MISFEDFCTELGDIKEIPVRRAGDFNEKTLPADSILIGCGSRFSELPDDVLLLDNKGSARRFGLEGDAKCVMRLVADPPRGFFENWRRWPREPLGPKAFLGSGAVTLVVEDASPDSTWGLLLLLMRIARCDLSHISPAWLTVIRRWEVEGMVDDPEIEWPSLASALAHSHFPGGGEPTSADYAKAWTETLSFAAGSLARNLSPVSIKNCTDWDLWHQASSALNQEKQAYHDWLQNALIVQLSLPMEKSADRRLLVDALILEEDFPTGASKVFYRNDRINSPLKEGFALAAHYRPEKRKETRKDIVIAVDPRKGVHLYDLWHELEEREIKEWEKLKKHRPDDKPRADLDSHLNEPNQWNQPWYIDRTKTIVAAPNAIDHETPGSRLDWKEVKNAIWHVYNPLTNVRVCRPPDNARDDSQNENVPLLKLTPEEPRLTEGEPEGVKRLFLADWPRHSPPQRTILPRSFSDAPVVERVIATLVERRTTREEGIDSLVAQGTWERVKLDAGFAIVTENGVFVLDDWRPSPRLEAKDIAEIKTAFGNANQLDQKLKDLQKEVNGLEQKLKDSLKNRASRWKQPKGLVAGAAYVSLRLADLRARTLSVSPKSDVRRVAEALDRRWALTSRLSLLEQQTKAIRDSVKELSDAQDSKIVRFVGVYGFPFYVAQGLADHLADPIAAHWPILASGNKASPPLWSACFLVIAALTWLLVNVVYGHGATDKPG